METYVSHVPGHEGECVQVDHRWVTLYQKHLPIFRNVKTRWWWPFYKQYGEAFPGEVTMFEVQTPATSNLKDRGTPRRKSVVSVGEAVAMSKGERPQSTLSRYAKYVAQAPASDDHDAYIIDNTPLWRGSLHEHPVPYTDPDGGLYVRDPIRSGGGGDFGGGGASGAWEPDRVPAGEQKIHGRPTVDEVREAIRNGTSLSVYHDLPEDSVQSVASPTQGDIDNGPHAGLGNTPSDYDRAPSPQESFRASEISQENSSPSWSSSSDSGSSGGDSSSSSSDSSSPPSDSSSSSGGE